MAPGRPSGTVRRVGVGIKHRLRDRIEVNDKFSLVADRWAPLLLFLLLLEGKDRWRSGAADYRSRGRICTPACVIYDFPKAEFRRQLRNSRGRRAISPEDVGWILSADCRNRKLSSLWCFTYRARGGREREMRKVRAENVDRYRNS